MEGEAMDIGQLLRNSQGKPKMSVISIPHLNDQERIFFVALLLNELLAWVRTQAGTSSLRALLYMDEIFGYFPPLSNPPTKKPLLTLLKQARAFGVGIVLATQNPVDLDYKGLSNCGTWFIGRLQTERDMMRLMDGLSGASAEGGKSFDAQATQRILSGLGKRVFYMNNVHADAPVIFQSRWALSYLRGPLTRDQIKVLTAKGPQPAAQAPGAAAKIPQLAAAVARPVLPPEVVQKFLAPRGKTDGLMYYPHMCVATKIRFADTTSGVDETVDRVYLSPVKDDNTPVEWSESHVVDLHPDELENDPVEGIGYAELSGAATKAKNYVGWQKDLVTYVYGNESLGIFRASDLKEFSNPGETESDFRARVSQKMREERDTEIARIRVDYGAKIDAAQERVRKAQAARDMQSQKRTSDIVSTGIGILGTVLGAMFGGGKVVSKTNISKAATAASPTNASPTSRPVPRVNTSQSRAGPSARPSAFSRSPTSARAGQATARRNSSVANAPVETVSLKPKKSNINIGFTALVWVPCKVAEGKDPEAAW